MRKKKIMVKFSSFFFHKVIKREIYIKSQIYGEHTHYLMINDVKFHSLKFTTHFRADIWIQ